MKNGLFGFLKKNNRAVGLSESTAQRKETATVNTDFVNSLTFEENPFENEIPADTKMYDLDGNEVTS